MKPYVLYFRKYTFKGLIDRKAFFKARKKVYDRFFSNKKFLTLYELKLGFDMLLNSN